jgi:hypothetical protein
MAYVNSSIKPNFNQPANVNLKPRKRYVFWIYVIIRYKDTLFQNSNTFRKEFVLHYFHIYYLFVVFIGKHLKNHGIIFAFNKISFLLPTIIPLSGVGTTCLNHVVIKIRHLFLRPAACLTSTLLETGVEANCIWSRDQQLNVPSQARRSSR